MILDFQALAAIQIGLILLSVGWFFWRNDEMPLLISVVVCYFGSYRYWSVTNGYGQWMDLSFYGLGQIEPTDALKALNFMALGQTTITFTYLLLQRSFIARTRSKLSSTAGVHVRTLVFALAIVIIPLVYRTRQIVAAQVENGKNPGFEISSYLQQFPWAIVGVACLLILLWKFGALNQLRYCVFALILLGIIFDLSFATTGRFLFVGWIIGGALALTSGFSPGLRFALLACLLGGGLMLFGIAGAPRDNLDSRENQNSEGWRRVISADDANMLDGFVYYQRVYPSQLAFTHGMHHAEIFLRPIPRSLWPEKPVGGYLNKLGLITASDATTLEICPSIFGSFYQEGGLWAVVLLAIIYGALAACWIALSARVHPFAGLMMRMILSSWGILLLRGGDLPGVYAWLGTAFWPCALVILWIRKDLRNSKSSESTPIRATRGKRPQRSHARHSQQAPVQSAAPSIISQQKPNPTP